METKPYAIQSPEDIAKEYGGNKQRIAQAAQIGLLDPTAAVLAGMFIDRMRGAQSQEQAPQRTVAQQVLAPQPAAPADAGLGATPEAAQLAAAYPAEGAPPPVPGPSMPQEPVMAADGGLMSLPVDDSMFEPSYNSGGIVAFATGSDDKPVQGEGVIAERERERLRRVIQARAAAISDPTARAQFLNQITKLSPDEQRQALGEITLAPVPSMSNVEGAPLAGSPGVIRGEGLTVTESPRRGLTSTGSQTLDNMIADEMLRNPPAPLSFGSMTEAEIAAGRARNAAPAAPAPADARSAMTLLSFTKKKAILPRLCMSRSGIAVQLLLMLPPVALPLLLLRLLPPLLLLCRMSILMRLFVVRVKGWLQPPLMPILPLQRLLLTKVALRV
jgi:hypothetical protein